MKREIAEKEMCTTVEMRDAMNALGKMTCVKPMISREIAERQYFVWRPPWSDKLIHLWVQNGKEWNHGICRRYWKRLMEKVGESSRCWRRCVRRLGIMDREMEIRRMGYTVERTKRKPPWDCWRN